MGMTESHVYDAQALSLAATMKGKLKRKDSEAILINRQEAERFVEALEAYRPGVVDRFIQRVNR